MEIEIRHDGLKKYRHIRGTNEYVVKQKAAAQQAVWEEMWEKQRAIQAKKDERERAAQEKQEKKELAAERTKEAEDAIDALKNTLKYTLEVNDAIEWESLKEPKPTKPVELEIPPMPKEQDLKYSPNIRVFDHILFWIKQKKVEEANIHFCHDIVDWKKRKDEIPLINEQNQKKYETDLIKWEKKNEAIDKQKQEYLKKSPEAIADYCDMVLSNSKYPDSFPQEFEIDYNPQNKILIVDYSMPSIKCVPKVKEVKYIQSRDDSSEVLLNDATVNKLYDDLLYQITLRSIHELFEADVIEALDAIVFNGWVRSIDTSTGKEVNACILSVQAGRKEFLEINLAQIDPKACFKKLKGIGSAQLHGLSPIAPVLTINREDKRFVAAYDVVDRLDGSYNLAIMDWQDFENLIREVFEKEFTQGGGEVKITQASRDGGVDAVAFDPDPIRGGKIVIQAKRYTNTVGVSAVRDLYGTVINEGATKGILVTTADYGPDAYSFAKGKPLTLLNGNNLLHLLGKYGHKARIDLKEAKKILGDIGT